MEKKIYKRLYDNPINKDGTEKENEFLGTFNVKQQIPMEKVFDKKRTVRKKGIILGSLTIPLN